MIDHPVLTFVFALCCILSAFAWTLLALSIIPRTSSMPKAARIVGAIGLEMTAVSELIIGWYVLFRPEMKVGDLGGSWALVSGAVVATVGLCGYTGALFARAPLDSHIEFVRDPQIDLDAMEDVSPSHGLGAADGLAPPERQD